MPAGILLKAMETCPHFEKGDSSVMGYRHFNRHSMRRWIDKDFLRKQRYMMFIVLAAFALVSLSISGCGARPEYALREECSSTPLF